MTNTQDMDALKCPSTEDVVCNYIVFKVGHYPAQLKQKLFFQRWKEWIPKALLHECENGKRFYESWILTLSL